MEKNENEWNVSNLVWEQHEGNGMEWNNHKRMEVNGMEVNGMEWNGIYLSKGKEWKRTEWNGMELSNLDWMF